MCWLMFCKPNAFVTSDKQIKEESEEDKEDEDILYNPPEDAERTPQYVRTRGLPMDNSEQLAVWCLVGCTLAVPRT